MPSRFSEAETEAFYDAEDALYRSFWDREGSLHWGWFDQESGDDFLAACVNLNRVMLEKAQIKPAAQVLDLGCGNGNTATWLCASACCQVTGIDLSGVRINNANESLRDQVPEVRARLTFEKTSATDLPFDADSFSHVWSQATIYHIPDKEKTLQEVYRVLKPGGLFVFDDLTKPGPNISDNARKFVYDRLLFDTDFSFSGYQDALQEAGFRVLEAHDLSENLKKSYACLSQMALSQKALNPDTFEALSHAYEQMVNAIEREELGWGMFLCQK